MKPLMLCVLLISFIGCSHNNMGKETLATEFTVIEGRLAAKPHTERGNKRLILYIGDKVIPEQKTVKPPPPLKDAVTGSIIRTEEGEKVVVNPEPESRLTNIRKAVTENTEEEWILLQLKDLLSTMKIGPEGPTVRLYGKHLKGKRWQEQVGGIDFWYCYVGYDDKITGEDVVIDTCYGNRWQDDFFKFFLDKTKEGAKSVPKMLF